MLRSTPRRRCLVWCCLGVIVTLLITSSNRAGEPPATATAPTTAPAEAAPAKAPPERTYSNTPFVHRIPILDEDGTAIRPAKPGEEPAPNASAKPMSQALTCGKCHSDYPAMQQGWHFNPAQPRAPHGRPGEPWILVDLQTRTQLPVSYRPWPGVFHPYDVGINDFQFARLFGRHHPGGGVLQTSADLRFKMSGPLENDCLICHTSDVRYDPVARANAITIDQNFKFAPTLAAFLGRVQGQASRLRDNFDPTGPQASRAPKVTYDPSRFDDMGNVVFNVSRRVSNERCYFCHTNIDVGRSITATATNEGLESRWRHDRDIHLVKGMMCVDCHRNGADHMMVRGYEGEYDDRVEAATAGAKPDATITTLTCAGCHYGGYKTAGGRNAAPQPVHRGLPTLHFDKLTCTACHSGPMPADATTMVQTAMAHKLGLPRHQTVDAAAPTIQQPVFIRVDQHGQAIPEGGGWYAKIAPHRMIVPSFWGRMGANEKITPIRPDDVIAAGADAILGEKPDEKESRAMEPLTQEQIAQVLEKLAAAPAGEVKPADVVSARGGATTTSPTTPATMPAGEPVFVTGTNLYKRGSGGKLESIVSVAAAPYYWPIAHDVRGAQQALGARGCTECHASGAPIFDSKVDTAAVITGASTTGTMAQWRMESTGALGAFAATYPLRWLLILIGYASAGILLLVILLRAMQMVAGRRA